MSRRRKRSQASSGHQQAGPQQGEQPGQVQLLEGQDGLEVVIGHELRQGCQALIHEGQGGDEVAGDHDHPGDHRRQAARGQEHAQQQRQGRIDQGLGQQGQEGDEPSGPS